MNFSISRLIRPVIIDTDTLQSVCSLPILHFNSRQHSINIDPPGIVKTEDSYAAAQREVGWNQVVKIIQKQYEWNLI